MIHCSGGEDGGRCMLGGTERRGRPSLRAGAAANYGRFERHLLASGDRSDEDSDGHGSPRHVHSRAAAGRIHPVGRAGAIQPDLQVHQQRGSGHLFGDAMLRGAMETHGCTGAAAPQTPADNCARSGIDRQAVAEFNRCSQAFRRQFGRQRGRASEVIATAFS
jgi:hypothetical protein